MDADPEVEEEANRDNVDVDDTASITFDEMKSKTKIECVGNIRCCCSSETSIHCRKPNASPVMSFSTKPNTSPTSTASAKQKSSAGDVIKIHLGHASKSSTGVSNTRCCE